MGGDLHDQIRRSERRSGKDEIDVEILLNGAEKLCGVYPLPGALEQIAALRSKYAHNRNTLAYYEAKVAEQAEALGRMNKDHWMDEEEDDGEDAAQENEDIVTEEDLKREEEQIKELEKKKRELQGRLKAIGADIDGLMNL